MVDILLPPVLVFPNTSCFEAPGVSKHCGMKTHWCLETPGFPNTQTGGSRVSTVFGVTVNIWCFNIFVKTPIVFTYTGY